MKKKGDFYVCRLKFARVITMKTKKPPPRYGNSPFSGLQNNGFIKREKEKVGACHQGEHLLGVIWVTPKRCSPLVSIKKVLGSTHVTLTNIRDDLCHGH